MDAEIKAEWVAALRSGEYKQGHSSLRQTGGKGEATYCCLGVLCDLYAKKGEGDWSGSAFSYGEGRKDDHAGPNWGHGVLPDNLWKAIGLSSENPAILGSEEGANLSLAELNDGFGAMEPRTFSQIADIIEREF